MSVKQTLIFRRDLKVRKGKLIAQGGHGAMAFLVHELMSPEAAKNTQIYNGDRLQRTITLTPEQHQWMEDKFTKICLVVDGEAELRALHAEALKLGLTSHMIIDAGMTEFAGVPTLTCIAIGPHEAERIDVLTKDLDMF